MSSPKNPFRGGNVCHRLELPKRPRRPRPGRRTRASIPEPPERVVLRTVEREVPVPAPADVEREKEIRVLERRLAKVRALLDLRESELQELVRRGEVDPGLGSIYKSVQGLEGNSDHVQRRREMMARIFEANLQLQRKLAGGEHSDALAGR